MNRIPKIEELLLNEYNQALDLRNLNKSKIMAFRALSIGTSFTLIGTVLTAQVLAIGIYITIVLIVSGLMISLFWLEYKLTSKLERIGNYCDYIQLIIKEESSVLSKGPNPHYIPLSFAHQYINKEEINLKQSIKRYNSTKLDDLLKKKPLQLKEWIIQSSNLLRFIFLLIIIIIIVFVSVMGIITGSELATDWIDVWSAGHIGFGMTMFCFLSLMYTLPRRDENKELISILYVFIITILGLIMWEIVENTLLLEVGIKSMPDSPQNIISDLIFGVFGAGSQLILFNFFYEEKEKVKIYYGFGIAGLILFIIYTLIVPTIVLV